LGEVDKRKIELAAPIKVAGSHSATIRLHGDVIANITIQVVGKK
jgi:large subunit ribosomal protein L9